MKTKQVHIKRQLKLGGKLLTKGNLGRVPYSTCYPGWKCVCQILCCELIVNRMAHNDTLPQFRSFETICDEYFPDEDVSFKIV